MGSFNVACSISNLSLSAGTKVAFFPLLPRSFGGGALSLHGGEKYLSGPNRYYFPFSLPIHGTYDDYGSVEAIIKDENTNAIERFFGISIEAFVEGIGAECPEEIANKEKATLYQCLSGMFVHQEIFEELVAYDVKEKHLANDYLTQGIAEFYGFEVVPQEEQFFKDTHCRVLMRKKGVPYDLKIGKYGAHLLHERHREYYAFAFGPLEGKQIAQYWEQATGAKLEEVFTDDIHFDQLTNEQYAVVKKKFTELTGAPLGWSEDREDKHAVYSVKQFAQAYEKITGESLDTSIWYQISQYDQQYSEFQQALRSYKREPLDHDEILARATDEEQRKFFKRIIEMNQKFEAKNDFGYEANQLDFMKFFKEMDFFKQLYAPLLMTSALREPFKEFQAFYWSMYSCNRFFFPAMNGEQEGNPEASAVLLKKSLEIVEKR